MQIIENVQAPMVTDMKVRLKDILLIVSWRELSKKYFGKSSSWLYHKMDGISGNGTPGGFTKREAEAMKSALLDLSNRIRIAAESI